MEGDIPEEQVGEVGVEIAGEVFLSRIESIMKRREPMQPEGDPAENDFVGYI